MQAQNFVAKIIFATNNFSVTTCHGRLQILTLKKCNIFKALMKSNFQEITLGIIGGDQGYNDSDMMQQGYFEHTLSMYKDIFPPFPRTLWIDRSTKQLIQ